MQRKLGIVGGVADVDAVRTAARALDIVPVFLLDGNEAAGTMPPDAAVEPVNTVEPELLHRQLAALELGGLLVPDAEWPSWTVEAVATLGWAHLPCLPHNPGGVCKATGARLFALDTLIDLVKRGGDGLAVPAWVRASCGDGDASCMRVEHLSDFSLALEKLRNRNPTGVLRIQPAIEGNIYRLVAFKAGDALVPAALLEEWVTPSVYRVPLGMALPVPPDTAPFREIERQARELNERLPDGWGYVEMEFVAADGRITMTDVQAPARLGTDLDRVARYALGLDLMGASMQCALGQTPDLAPVREKAVAFSWLLTRSGVVTGFEGLEAARAMPGVVDIVLNVQEGDILTHVVDVASRDRGGYIMTEGATMAEAKSRLEAARERVWINTSPALS